MSLKKYFLKTIFAVFFFNYSIFASQNEINPEQDNDDKKLSYHEVLSAKDYIDTTESYYFDTQKRDAKLHDYSDSLGFYKFKNRLTKLLNPKVYYIPNPKVYYIPNPQVYRISLGDKSFILLGSCHSVPLEYFSKEIRNIFDQCHFLILESRGRGNINRSFLERINALQNENSESIFDDLDDPIRNHFEYIVEDCLRFYQIKDVKYKELNPSLAYALYFYRHNIGMDKELSNKFFYQKKPVFGLENVEHNLPKFIEQLSKLDPLSLYKKLENDFVSGGNLNTSAIFNLNCEYIRGETGFLNWLLSSDDKNRINRNYQMKIK
ncbi:MAG: hypothetical protein ACRYGR_01000 [Janthinobacterium lividum]